MVLPISHSSDDFNTWLTKHTSTISAQAICLQKAFSLLDFWELLVVDDQRLFDATQRQSD